MRLTVADEGRGFDPKTLEARGESRGSAGASDSASSSASSGASSRAGLRFVSMRERLRFVRGTIDVHAAPGQGTRIDVWVPAWAEPTPPASA